MHLTSVGWISTGKKLLVSWGNHKYLLFIKPLKKQNLTARPLKTQISKNVKYLTKTKWLLQWIEGCTDKYIDIQKDIIGQKEYIVSNF